MEIDLVVVVRVAKLRCECGQLLVKRARILPQQRAPEEDPFLAVVGARDLVQEPFHRVGVVETAARTRLQDDFVLFVLDSARPAVARAAFVAPEGGASATR